MNTENFKKTGTTTVGIVAKDCIILAADKRATAGNFIADKKVEKVVKINDYLALTTAGSVSDIQLIVKVIRAEISLKEIRSRRRLKVKEAANLLSGIVYGSIRNFSMVPSVVHFLFAGSDDEGNHMYDIYPDGSISEIDRFVSSGSGSMFAYGLFETQYKEGMSKDSAMELAMKAVNAAMQRDSASGEGIDVMMINGEGVKKIMTKKVDGSLK